MRAFRKIVVGLDLHPDGRITGGSWLALLQARWVARRVGSHITLIHSSRVEESWDEKTGGYAFSRAETDQRSALEAAVDHVGGDGTEVELVISEEKAWLAITRHVLREGTDLVITGRRTESFAEGPFLGSVSTKLLRKCPCSVWVVKPDSKRQPDRLLAATDLTPVGERVLELASSLAEACSSELHVVHAFQMPISVQMEGTEAEEQYVRETRAESCEKIHSSLEHTTFSETAHLHVGLFSPTRAITDCVQRLRPDLVVMGTISRGGIPGVLVGNTAERLLGRLDCSLLTVKPADFVCPVTPKP
jgi:universal stress protein E